MPGLIVTSLNNPNLKWQENTMQNYGFDLGLLDNRVSITAEYYVSTSGDMLVRIPQVPSLGSLQDPFVNAGSIQNTGFEFSLGHAFNRRGLELNSGFNFSTIRNKVISLGNGGQDIITGVSRTAVGEPMGALYVYDMVGIFQTDAEAAAYVHPTTGARIQPGTRAGDVQYRDTNGDGVINASDRIVAGNPWPTLEGGAFLDGRYGRFDFNLGLRGSYGADVYNQFRADVESMTGDNNTPTWLEPWTPQNQSNTTPIALFGGGGTQNALASQRWIEDGSYLKLQNIQVGYSLPENILQRVGVTGQGARVYLNLQNIHTFTSYLGYDPEFARSGGSAALLRGIDAGTIYPNPRSITIGVDLGF
jgi:TonB-dependent starch-binding outer membrane protein SusC